MGATVGSVIPTVGAIIPAAVGVDIGCVEGAAIREWIGKAVHLAKDADHQIDFGSIDVFGENRDVRIETEMFALRLDMGVLTDKLD